MSKGTILWWGRFDPDYSRNRILLQILREWDWEVVAFQPQFSRFGDLEAVLKGIERPQLVWVPCFRQRDIAAASRFCRRKGIPLLTDPLISAYDKQVFEREKFPPSSKAAQRLLNWEGSLFNLADCVLADTQGHAEFFCETLKVDKSRVAVVPVGAEEGLFSPVSLPERTAEEQLEVLFYGSFISLQGPQYIVEAARRYQGPPVVWRLVGNGPLLEKSRLSAAGLDNVAFEDWVDYHCLPERIGRADILLGVFGTSAKAARVIPNKVYQAMACGRPVVTLSGSAYPQALLETSDNGLRWVPAGDPEAIGAAVARLAADRDLLANQALASRQSYNLFLSVRQIRSHLHHALSELGLMN